MDLDLQARQLNDQISAKNPSVTTMLSARGRAIYFPKMGILSQSADARGKEIDATIGIALEEDGTPMRLPCIAQRVQLPPEKIFTYAPSSGRPELRQAWKDLLVKKNPSLAGKAVSLPVVTCALSHGLSMSGYLFCDPGDRVILPDLYWENYELIFRNAYDAILDPFPTFAGAGFNVEGLRKKLMAGPPRKTLVCLNFPNNPTGYTPTGSEVEGIVGVFREAAERGSRLVVIVDDAYFGLVYEPGIFAESIFGLLCDLHPNLLAVKLDGATKEDYVWGLRVGFMTYGIQGGAPPLYQALEAKTTGAIRGNISNGSNLSQSLLVGAFVAPAYEAEKQQKYELLRRRYEKVKQILAARPEYRGEFVPMPFNSGYFMCLKMLKADPERVRRKLLSDYSTGVIVMSGLVRLAFSSTPLDKLDRLVDNVFQAARALSAPSAE
ncbi:MAG: aminotransferase class I/II-fold pyridoxal phosphate-dependent enzyme [Verrucomicrobia bacterium]|nr:aminotransferase class I/II-fold pyridoxal phosphate-dependent enzyme [Verrucomicrobiota bacterium]MCG2681105.1 aminotransferase class I/II-fold pyridoxal phosphate-dependent enzyme [Kiritimatiellia bacterium]MBU4248214.1 aminotransferase class I/II-fold pyridoxal phosphate-dependent enzyme [Verrucomicrobiota bacterium]MBU4292328.1 aminotransferase class I/II-fold pyridoxal phosphate-dependent enzyme [Verrucomicrobiota bacterium]MBU4428621.1 aminotransferase class I/II-fold pyridoxal phospha